MKTLIIGVPGSGKTFLIEKMQEKGYPAYDADAIVGMCYWSTKTDEVVAMPDNPSVEWNTNHYFRWKRDVLENFIRDQKEVYIFGSSYNVYDMLNLFDNSYYLQLSADKVHERLSAPDRENPVGFGKRKDQRDSIIAFLPQDDARARKYKVPFIDATLSPEEIIKKIVQREGFEPPKA